MNYISWLLLNIGVPVIGPVLMLMLTRVTHGKDVSKQLIVDSVKDGQLFWVTIALSAAAIYEARSGLIKGAHEGSRTLIEVGVWVFALIAIGCSIIVMVATMKVYNDRTKASQAMQGEQQQQGATIALQSLSSSFVSTSVWLAVGTSLLFAALHGYIE